MPVFLDSNDETFEDDFRHLLSMKREDSPDVDRAVAEIIEDVRTRGDAAVVDLTKRFDRFDITSDTLRISDAEIKEHISKVSHQERQALELAAIIKNVKRWNWQHAAFGLITKSNCRKIADGVSQMEPSLAGAGRPFLRRAYTFRAGLPVIHLLF